MRDEEDPEDEAVRDLAQSLRTVYERLQSGSGALPDALRGSSSDFLPREVSSFGELVTLIEKGPQHIPPAAPEIVVQKIRLWAAYLTTTTALGSDIPLEFPTFEFGADVSTAIAILASNNLLTTAQKLAVTSPLEKYLKFTARQLERAPRPHVLAEWWLLAAAILQTSLAALGNITPQAGHVALDLLRVTTDLPPPVANTTDLLEVQIVALSAIRVMLKSGPQRNPLDAPNSKILITIFKATAIRSWERTSSLAFDYQQLGFPEQFLVPSKDDADAKISQIRKIVLAIAGDAAAADEQCALALSSRTNESTLLVQDSLHNLILRRDMDTVQAFLGAIIEFALRAAASSSGTVAAATFWAISIEAIIENSSDDDQRMYKQMLLQNLFNFLEKGQMSACRIFSRGNLYNHMALWHFSHAAVLELLSAASQISGNDGSDECAAALRLASEDSDAESIVEIVKCSTSMLLCTTAEGSARALRENNVLESACQIALMLADRIVANFDDLLVHALKETFLLLESLFVHPIAYTVVLHTDHAGDALLSLMSHELTVQAGTKHLVATLTSSHPDEDFDDEGDPTSPRSRLPRNSSQAASQSVAQSLKKPALGPSSTATPASPVAEEEILLARRLLFKKFCRTMKHECSTTLEKGITHVATSTLRAMRSLVRTEKLRRNQKALRECHAFETVVGLLDWLDPQGLEKEETFDLVSEVLETLVALFKGNRRARAYMNNIVGYKSVVRAIGKCLQSSHDFDADIFFGIFFAMVVEEDSFAPGNRDIRIKNAGPLRMAIDLVRHIGAGQLEKRIGILEQVIHLAETSTPNRAAVAAGNILDVVLEWLPEVCDCEELALKLVSLTRVIAEYSITAAQLSQVLALVRDPNLKSKRIRCALLGSLEHSLLPRDGPLAFFDFSGRKSGLVAGSGSPIIFHLSRGYAVATWIRCETTGEADLFYIQDDKKTTSSISLNQFGGLSARVSTAGAKHRDMGGPSAVNCDVRIPQGKWCHLVVSHSAPGTFSRTGDLEIFLNAQKVACGGLRYPRFSGALELFCVGCCVASGSTSKTANCFRGQLGAVYMIGDNLTQDTVTSMYALGPSYDGDLLPYGGTIQRGVESGALPKAALNAVEGGRLAERVRLLYAPRAADSRICPENSALGAAGAHPTTFARLVGPEGATQRCVAADARNSLSVLGGIKQILLVLAQLDNIGTPLDEQSPTSIDVFDHCLRLLVAILAGDRMYQVAMSKCNGFGLLGSFLLRSPPENFTAEAVESIWRVLDTVSGDEELAVSMANSVILQYKIWRRFDAQIQLVFWSRVLRCWDTDDTSTLDATPGRTQELIRRCFSVHDVSEEVPFVPSRIRPILYDVLLHTIRVYEGSENEEKRDSSTLAFVGLLYSAAPHISLEQNNEIVDEVLSIIHEQLLLKNQAGASTCRAICGVGQSAIAALICVFWSPSKPLQHKAIRTALMLARKLDSQQTEDITIATATAALIFSGADMGAHYLAAQLAFGDTTLGTEPFDAAIPIVFCLAAVDDNVISRVTVLRELESELLGSDSSVTRILQFSTWPVWLSKLLYDSESRLSDECGSVVALEEACGRLIRAILSVVFKSASNSSFRQNVNTVVFIGSESFQRRALLTLLSITQERYIPFVSLHSVRQDRQVQQQTHRYSIIIAAAEAYLFTRRESLDEEVASTVVDTSRLLGLWVVESIGEVSHPKNATAVESSSPQETISAPSQAGGILRCSLRILCFLIAGTEGEVKRDSYIEVLCAAVAPPNGQVISTVWLSYVKQSLAKHISIWTPRGKQSKVEGLIKAVAMIESQWIKVKYKSKGKPDKDSAGMEYADVAAAEILEQDGWTDEFVRKMKYEVGIMKDLSTSIESDMLGTAAKAREWALEAVMKRREAASSRIAGNTARFIISLRDRNAEWKMLKQESEWEEASGKPRNGPEFWILDGHYDSLNRRWLLRLNPEGTDHLDAALDTNGSGASGLEEEREPKSNEPIDTISPLLRNHSRNSAVGMAVEEDDIDDEEDPSRCKNDDCGVGRDSFFEQNLEDSSVGTSQESPAFLGPLSVFSPLSQPTAVLWANNSRLISPLSVVPGRLELGRNVVVFTPTEGSKANDPQQGGGHWPSGKKPVAKDSVISLEDIEEIHYRRYMLRPVALEIFLAEKSSVFFALETESASRTLLKMLETQLRRNNINAKVFRTARSCQSAARDVKEAWKRASISNFEYLMEINKLSGRSYNDISQYPVFPWVLADYHSNELDLEDPKTFRNLNKPMGCQPAPGEVVAETEISEREVYFRERYESWSDPRGIPPFHYGSHYSSAGTVLHFLVRMEPFASLFIQIQGGHFDYADRMFRSIGGAFESATSSTQNVNELTPEFFYSVDFLKNRNHLPLGVTQDEALIDDVELPPWAGNSPERFIRLQREALECPFVSSQLHSWVDLIFGQKQRGPAAVDACNVFYYLTYEKAIDLDSISDTALRVATESQIMHFGQTPMQLYSGKSHPQREKAPYSMIRASPSKGSIPKLRHLNFETENSLTGDPLVWMANAVDSILTVARSRSLGLHRWHPFPDLQGNPFTFEADIKLAGNDSAAGQKRKGLGKGRRLGGAHVAPGLKETKLGQLFVVTIDGRFVISGGHWDGTVRCSVISEPGHPKQILSYHRDVVTCVDLSADGQTLATGSRDASVFLWDVVWRGGDKSPLGHPTLGNSPVSTHNMTGGGGESQKVSTKVISTKPSMIFSGHIDPVTVVAINKDIGYVLSADEGGRVLLHSIWDGRLIRASLGKRITQAIPTILGEIICYSEEDNLLWVEGVNGGLVVEKRLQVRISAMAVSRDGRLVIAAFETNGVSVRTAWDLREVYHYSVPVSSVSSLTLASDESNIFIGLRNGQLQALSIDREELRRNSKMEGLRGPLPIWYSP